MDPKIDLFIEKAVFLKQAGYALIAVVLYKCTEALQYYRLKKRTAYCLECGWFGRGTDWYRYADCPECESERVDLR